MVIHECAHHSMGLPREAAQQGGSWPQGNRQTPGPQGQWTELDPIRPEELKSTRCPEVGVKPDADIWRYQLQN